LEKIFAGLSEAGEPAQEPEQAPPAAAGDQEATTRALEEFGIPPGLLESLGGPAEAQAESGAADLGAVAEPAAAEPAGAELSIEAEPAAPEPGVEAAPPTVGPAAEE